jgi:hypothetical protein
MNDLTPGPTRLPFTFEKWYVDALLPDGTVLVLYIGRLAVCGVRHWSSATVLERSWRSSCSLVRHRWSAPWSRVSRRSSRSSRMASAGCMDFSVGLYQQHLVSVPQLALRAFRDQVLAQSDRQALARDGDATGGAAALANAKYWFEHELKHNSAAKPGLDALKVLADRIVPRPAKRRGRKLVAMPGRTPRFSKPISRLR